jgi:hypothetical protein
LTILDWVFHSSVVAILLTSYFLLLTSYFLFLKKLERAQEAAVQNKNIFSETHGSDKSLFSWRDYEGLV